MKLSTGYFFDVLAYCVISTNTLKILINLVLSRSKNHLQKTIIFYLQIIFIKMIQTETSIDDPMKFEK